MGMMPNDRNKRLESVLKRFGIPIERANDDVNATDVSRTETAEQLLVKLKNKASKRDRK